MYKDWHEWAKDRKSIKEEQKLSEKMESSSHSLIPMMATLLSSHMPELPLSLLSDFYLFFLISFHPSLSKMCITDT